MHFLSSTTTINSLQIYCAKQIPSVITSWQDNPFVHRVFGTVPVSRFARVSGLRV